MAAHAHPLGLPAMSFVDEGDVVRYRLWCETCEKFLAVSKSRHAAEAELTVPDEAAVSDTTETPADPSAVDGDSTTEQ